MITRDSLNSLRLLIDWSRLRRGEPEPPAPWYAPTFSSRFIVLPIRSRDSKYGALNTGPNMQQYPRSRSDGAPSTILRGLRLRGFDR